MAVDTSRIEDILTKNGFTEHQDHPAHANVEALSHNGPYVVHGAWQRGDTIIHIEQNTAPDGEPEADGSQVIRTFPPVLVIQDTKSGGSFAVSFHDLEAFERVLSGEVDYNENGDSADPTSSKP
jgi:hypothetical protein